MYAVRWIENSLAKRTLRTIFVDLLTIVEKRDSRTQLEQNPSGRSQVKVARRERDHRRKKTNRFTQVQYWSIKRHCGLAIHCLTDSLAIPYLSTNPRGDSVHVLTLSLVTPNPLVKPFLPNTLPPMNLNGGVVLGYSSTWHTWRTHHKLLVLGIRPHSKPNCSINLLLSTK